MLPESLGSGGAAGSASGAREIDRGKEREGERELKIYIEAVFRHNLSGRKLQLTGRNSGPPDALPSELRAAAVNRRWNQAIVRLWIVDFFESGDIWLT